jgi:hypothetical protein
LLDSIPQKKELVMALRKRLVFILLALLAIMAAAPVTVFPAAGEIRISKGQTVYVPVYSNVYSGPRKKPLHLATMLSIRNVDLSARFQVTAIDYYNTDGRLVRRYLAAPLTVAPLATHHVYLEEKDTSGGFGANFIVRWSADKAINAPVIECVMIGAFGGQGISFVSPGQEVKE